MKMVLQNVKVHDIFFLFDEKDTNYITWEVV